MTNLIESAFPDTPAMPEFQVSNNLLGDPTALDAAWERDGYWFFRDVLDKDAVARARRSYLDVLRDLGVILQDRDDAAIYNGASLDGYPITMGGQPDLDPLLARYPSHEFLNEPKIKAFFEQVFRDEVFWVPNSEFHAVPPSSNHLGSRFNFVHADGPNNKGLPLKICWIPLAPISEAVGGLAITTGLHKPRLGDFERPPAGIRESDVPAGAWRRTIYEPGDLLMFSLDTPHSGLANRSDTFFRLSMDVRGMGKSQNIPTLGTIADIDRCGIMIQDDDGREHVFRIDDDSFCRIYRGRMSGIPLTRDEIPELLKIGSAVYVAHDKEKVTFLRPRH